MARLRIRSSAFQNGVKPFLLFSPENITILWKRTTLNRSRDLGVPFSGFYTAARDNTDIPEHSVVIDFDGAITKKKPHLQEENSFGVPLVVPPASANSTSAWFTNKGAGRLNRENLPRACSTKRLTAIGTAWA